MCIKKVRISRLTGYRHVGQASQNLPGCRWSNRLLQTKEMEDDVEAWAHTCERTMNRKDGFMRFATKQWSNLIGKGEKGTLGKGKVRTFFSNETSSENVNYCSLLHCWNCTDKRSSHKIKQRLSELKLTQRAPVVMSQQQVNWITVRQAGKAGTATHTKMLRMSG